MDRAPDGPTPPAGSPEEFLAEHLDRLVGFARALGGPNDAEDLVATAVLAALPRWTSITGSHYAYLRKCILHENVDVIRRAVRRRRLDPAVAPDRIDDSTGRIVVAHAVESAMAQLAPLQREVLVLRYFEDLPVTEVAALLDRPASSIRRITHEGLSALRALDLFSTDFGSRS